MKLLSKKQVCALTSLSPTQIGRLEKDKKFPDRVVLPSAKPAQEFSDNSRVAWVECEVIDWIKARVAKRTKPLP